MRRVVAAVLLVFGCALFGSPEQAFRARPYVWASEGRVELSSCRWLLGDPIGVALAADATLEEERALAAVLAAYESALPGLRFLRVPEGAGSISVRFLAAAVPTAAGALGNGRTVADCRLGVAGARAALVAATLEIARRAPPDWRERERVLSLEERTGALAHELGHALGAPGHASERDDPLVGAPEAWRRIGARVLTGQPLASPTLAALYARPAGELLQNVGVEEWRTAELDRLRRLATQNQLDGPYLRAGDAVGRIFWRDARGREWGFLVAGLDELAGDPSQLLLLPEASTRNALPRRMAP